MCLEVANICFDEEHMDESRQGRYGDTGYLYNVHYPVNPETFSGKSHDYLAVLKVLRDMGNTEDYMGRPVYVKAGFADSEGYMSMRL